MKQSNGTGELTSWSIISSGDIVIRVLGKDELDGIWAMFTIEIPWRHFETLVEAAYNDREEQAQAKIPGT